MSVPAYFIPAQESTDPENIADSFSESLVVGGYGRWYPEKPLYQTLSIDTVNKVWRNGALHVGRGFDQGWHNAPPTTDGFYFSFDAPIDLTDMQSISFLIHTFDRYYDNQNFTVPILLGQNAVALQDANGIVVYSPFFNNLTNAKLWTASDATSPRQYMKSDFSGSASFDWSRVTVIGYYIGIRAIDPTDLWAPNGYDIWIDGGPFIIVQGSALPVVQILCEDSTGQPILTKKNAQWYNYNSTPTIEQPIDIPTTLKATAGNYGVKATDGDFLRWSDGATNRLKNLTLASGITTVKAIYPPQSGVDLTTLAIVGGVIGIGGLALYYLRGK